ncbi:MAG: hypothetical protein GY816_05715, partial [Cytophagales bacterium]|nr:hypothetical protein [Cytophagales bacterium]
NSEFFDLEVYSNSFIDFERFFSSDLVVVHSLDHLPEWFDIERMSGDLIVIPTATLDENNYSNRLGFRVTRTGDSTFSQLKMKGFEHPFFDGLFDELDSRTSFPKVRSIFKIGTGETLLVADRPYLQRIDQKSKIYWFSSPLEEDYSTLQNHALFLPIMYRIAENSKGYNEPIAYTLSDTPLQIALANTTNQLLELKGVNGQFVPSTYFNQSNLITTLPSELNDPGYYYLTAGSDTLKVIALNIDRMESVLNGENSSGLADHFKAYPNVRVVDANSVQSLEASLSELVTGKKLWKYALLLALMFLVAETALHRWLK